MVLPSFHLFLFVLERLPYTILVQSLYHQLDHLVLQNQKAENC
ncbi:hypothetical protein HanXRQr2_Chr12g0546541 [Helianthus annuus]|uniref:Uncharacterized protein n=1 Tax=Helianthus annuus TaxID=4232 RepID=A0A9K3HHB4_HELAN|nr:hypothetical protein HanXRQr2_Chr12g0546541 [Helianthus annuus]KAJ0863109.1 hypothetical protein HanPSC8_Chr12g0526101 [Helianthus annuus]